MIRAAVISLLLLGSVSVAPASEPITLKIISINPTNIVVGGFNTGDVYRVVVMDSLVSPVWTWSMDFTASVSSVSVPRVPAAQTTNVMAAGYYLQGIDPAGTNYVWMEEHTVVIPRDAGFIRAWELLAWELLPVSIFAPLCSAFVWSARVASVLVGVLLFRFVSLRSLL